MLHAEHSLCQKPFCLLLFIKNKKMHTCFRYIIDIVLVSLLYSKSDMDGFVYPVGGSIALWMFSQKFLVLHHKGYTSLISV